MRFLLFVLVGNVDDRYDCVPRVNRTKTGTKTYSPLCTQANLRFRYQTGLIGLRFGTCVKVALGEFRGSSYNTNFIIK